MAKPETNIFGLVCFHADILNTRVSWHGFEQLCGFYTVLYCEIHKIIQKSRDTPVFWIIFGPQYYLFNDDGAIDLQNFFSHWSNHIEHKMVTIS